MRKGVKMLVIMSTLFSCSGCFSNIFTRTATNEISQVCNECNTVNDIGDLTDNVELVMNQVKAMKGEYTLVNTKDTFHITFDTITSEEKRIDWDLQAHINFSDKEIVFYLKDQKFYVIYPNKGTNIVMKDTIENLAIEAEDTLEKLNATYNKDNLNDLMMGDRLEGFNFVGMKESGTYVAKNNSYTIFYQENSLDWEYDITSNYLIKEARCKGENFTSTLTFEYPKELEITYPKGLDFLTVNIKNVKKKLDVESFAELIDESLKESDEK